MSCQKGNVKRTRPQKYQNKTVYKNDLHDKRKVIKDLNDLEISEVCKQCKAVIEWKIKYKKYKPLSQPKTCIECHQKIIKHAYHTLCDPCGRTLKVCCKCRQSKEVIHKSVKMKPKSEVLSMVKKDLMLLPERKRRTFYRYLDSLYGTNEKRRRKREKSEKIEEDEQHEEEEEERIEDEQREKEEEVKDERISKLPSSSQIQITEDYLEQIRAKLEELGKGSSRADKVDIGESEDESDNDCGVGVR